MSELPLVPFGKYKGQPITTLLNDKSYLDWCKRQPFFKKYTNIYNITVNQQITQPVYSKTPEHNKLQNLFLNNDYCIDFINSIYKLNINRLVINYNKILKNPEYLKYFVEYDIEEHYNKGHIKIIEKEFESKFNWDIKLKSDCYGDSIPIILKPDVLSIERKQYDVIKTTELQNKISIIESEDDHKVFTELGWKTKTEAIKNINEELYKNYENKFIEFISNKYHDILNNIIRETYPVSLYKSDNWNKIERKYNEVNITLSIPSYDNTVYCELKPILGDDYPCVLRKMKQQIELTNRFYRYRKHKYVLLINTFNSETTTIEQLKEIFKQSKITVITNQF